MNDEKWEDAEFIFSEEELEWDYGDVSEMSDMRQERLTRGIHMLYTNRHPYRRKLIYSGTNKNKIILPEYF